MEWKKVPAELGCLEFFKVEVRAVQNFSLAVVLSL